MSPRPVVRIRGWAHAARGARHGVDGARAERSAHRRPLPRRKLPAGALGPHRVARPPHPVPAPAARGHPARRHRHPARLRRQVDRAGDPPRESAGARRPLPVPRRSEGAGMSELMSPAARWGVAAAATVGFVTALLLSAFGGGGLRTTDVELSSAPLPVRAAAAGALRRPGPRGSRRSACRRSTCARRAPHGRAARPRPSRRRRPLRPWSRSPRRRARRRRRRSPRRRPRRAPPLAAPAPSASPVAAAASPRRNRPPRARLRLLGMSEPTEVAAPARRRGGLAAGIVVAPARAARRRRRPLLGWVTGAQLRHGDGPPLPRIASVGPSPSQLDGGWTPAAAGHRARGRRSGRPARVRAGRRACPGASGSPARR